MALATQRSVALLAERDLALSVQVLQEFYDQAKRASRPDAIGHQQAVLLIESFRRFPVQDITSGIMMAALDARQRFQLSYWDAAIIEHLARWAARKSCPKTSTTVRTMAASGWPIRSAEKPNNLCGYRLHCGPPLHRQLRPPA